MIITSQVYLNGHTWKELITNYLPNIRIFQLKMKLELQERNDDVNEIIDELLDSFNSKQPKHIGEHLYTLSNGDGRVESKKVKLTCEKSPQFSSDIALYHKTLSKKDENYSIAFDTDKNASILLIKQVNKSEHENEYIYHVVNEFEFVEQYPIEYQAEAYPEAIILWTRNGTYAIKLTNEVRQIELSIELAITERLIEVGKHFIDTIGLENESLKDGIAIGNNERIKMNIQGEKY
ncbi:unnamed protein product [Rotaria sp. Silwood1]|nr:unnamed protein product [Rotaria sp. Silwood1]